MLNKILSCVGLLLALCWRPALAGDGPWFFTEDAIANAYRYQRQFGARLRSPVEPQSCLYGKKEFTATHRGERLTVPCVFLSETVRQLKELLDSGAAKHLFPLDVGHADLALPLEIYASKYEKLPLEEVLPAALRDPTLVAIYRIGTHAKPVTASTTNGAPLAPERRIILGSYDGRQNRIAVETADGAAPKIITGLTRVGDFHLMEHFLGELGFIAGKSTVIFDLSLDDDFAETPSDNRSHVNAILK